MGQLHHDIYLNDSENYKEPLEKQVALWYNLLR